MNIREQEPLLIPGLKITARKADLGENRVLYRFETLNF